MAVKKREVKAIDYKQRQRQALELRKAGATYRQIAEQLGWADESSAWKAVKSALETLVKEPAEDLVYIQRERLNFLLLTIWPQVQHGDLGAIDRAIRIMEKQNELEGIGSQRHPSGDTHNTVVMIGGDREAYLQALREAREGMPIERAELPPSPPSPDTDTLIIDAEPLD